MWPWARQLTVELLAGTRGATPPALRGLACRIDVD
jgi:hypothetical protein